MTSLLRALFRLLGNDGALRNARQAVEAKRKEREQVERTLTRIAV